MLSPCLRGRAFLSSLLIFCTLFTPLQRVSATTNDSAILIGEVQWSGSSRSTADEWIELWNTGTDSVNLNGWSLIGASDKPIYFTSSTVIAPQQTLLITNYLATSDKTLLGAHRISVATTSLALSNDQLQIELHDSSGVLIDSAGNGGKPPAGTSSPTNTSMIRTRVGTIWNWRSATNTFFPGAPDLGTPGICDECMLSPTTNTQVIITPSTTDSIPVEPSDLTQEDSTSTIPDTDTPLLEPEEALLYGITPTDALEEQDPTSTSTISYEPFPIGTSTTALPALSETPSSSSTFSITTTTEVTTAEDQAINNLAVSTSTHTVASSTQDASSTMINAPSTAEVSSVSTPAITTTPSLPVEPSLPDPLITEILSAAAANESEWIELKLPEGASPLRYINWKIEVDGKTLLVFTPETLSSLEQYGPYLLATWKSAKLKNAGATIRLLRADGTLAQEASYGASLKGTSWINEANSGWKLTKQPTKGGVNILVGVDAPLSSPKIQKTILPKGVTSSQKSISTKTTPKKIDLSSSSTTSTGDIRSLELAANRKTASTGTSSTSKTEHPQKTKAKTNPLKTSKPAKKSTSKKSFLIPSHVTHFEQIPAEQLSPRVRVRLQGLVGSTVGVFGKQRFVLLAPDGRGLLVKATAHQPSPTLGSTIEVTGLLFANDEGVQLQMQSGDLWKSIPSATTSSPRIVDWNAPGIEDQWSFTRLEGQVTDSRPSAIVLETQIGEVTIPIKTIIGYRAQRVKNGDTLEVSGIFDGRNGLWKVQPSQASDIVILKHPEPETKAAASSPSNTQLPWNAIGIAIGSIGAVEGIRRWLEKRKATQLLPKQPLISTP